MNIYGYFTMLQSKSRSKDQLPVSRNPLAWSMDVAPGSTRIIFFNKRCYIIFHYLCHPSKSHPAKDLLQILDLKLQL
jgi:hypothetical protein